MLSPVTENAYAVAQSRKSDVYNYIVVLLELITRKIENTPSLNDENKLTILVTWARSVWLEIGNIEMIVDSYLASSFHNSTTFDQASRTNFFIGITETVLQKRPTMKYVVDFNVKHEPQDNNDNPQ